MQDEDFRKFTYILASDQSNLRTLEARSQGGNAIVKLFGSFDDGQPIADPYYGGIVRDSLIVPMISPLMVILQGGFERCYQQCTRYANAFLDAHFGHMKSSM